MREAKTVTVTQLDGYDDIIDVRSPAEYAEDHIPGATSAPVLSDAERAHVGTLYAKVSPFEAKRHGSALIARNIAHHLETLFRDKPRDWRPLVYCWRGGQRSGAMAHVMAQVGWHVSRLDGGYKAYRRHVIEELQRLPDTLTFRVVCGATGTGKSHLLDELRKQDAQVLDLERLARHRGSLLGGLPDEKQPAQKMFDSLIWDALRGFDPARPVFVEAESKKIGLRAVPDALLDAMRRSACILIEAPIEARVKILMQDYAHFLNDPALLARQLAPLVTLHGRKTLDEWDSLAGSGDWNTLVSELLSRHYDPAYRRSTASNYPQLGQALVLHATDLNNGHMHALASRCLAHENASLPETAAPARGTP